MDTIEANGRVETAPVRVKFGPRPNQDMPLPWAEFMLAKMREAQENNTKPRQFGDLLALAAMESGR